MKRQRLTKMEVVEQLQAWHARGVAVHQLWRQNPAVTSRAASLFGAWRNALAAAGFNSSRQRWSRERIVGELKLRRGNRRTNDGKLETAAVRYFGSMQAALTAAGLSFKRRPNKCNWTKDTAAKAIQRRVASGQCLRATCREAPSLYSAAKRLWGSWRAACEAAGYSIPVQKRYSQGEVLKRIRDRYNNGLSLTNMGTLEPDLYRSARRCFGSWRKAVLQAGLPIKMPQRWTQQKVIHSIRQRKADGYELCRTWQEDKALFRAAVSLFGNWEPAMLAAGFTPIRRERWSKQRVVERLQTWRKRTRDTNLSESDPKLAGAAIRLFGSLETACEVAGIVASPRRWTKERVIAEIQERYVQGEPKHIQGLGDIRLALAAKRRFGSWASAVAAAGLADRIPTTKPLRRWTKKQVLDSIQRATREGISLSKVSSFDQGLYNAAKTHFGSWRNAVRAAGLPTTRQQWSKALILAGILARYRSGSSLSSGHPDNINLVAASSRHFGSWTAALVAAGVKATPTQRRHSS